MLLHYRTKAISALTLNFAVSFVFSERNWQTEEPNFVQIPTHPIVDENPDLEPDPFTPTKIQKPLVPTVIANCKCGEHDYNSTKIEQLKCGERPPPRSAAYLVANGTITDKNQFPWVVALIERTATEAIHFCGGTLISSKLAITATHCFVGRSVNSTEVWLNERNVLLSSEDKNYPALKIKALRLIVHPDYNPRWNYNDIVIVELSEAIDIQESHLRPICLPNDESYDNKEFAYTAGWGRISYKGPKSPVLLHVCLPLLTHEQCTTKSLDYYKKRITREMICAGDLKNGGIDACPGDSGGPLFVESGPGRRHYIVGIVSWGEQCALPRRPGVYTRVSKYTPWIESVMSSTVGNKKCG